MNKLLTKAGRQKAILMLFMPLFILMSIKQINLLILKREA